MSVIHVLVSTKTPSAAFEASGRSLIVALTKLLEKERLGPCYGVSTSSVITLEVDGAPRQFVEPLLTAYLAKTSQTFPDMVVSIKEVDASKLSGELKAVAQSLNSPPQKLTQKHLISLSEGQFLVSNIFTRAGVPVFAEWVAPMRARNDQWSRIQLAGGDQRNCHVFRSEDDYRRWLSGFARHQ